MEEFGEDMFKDGMISLMNIDNEVLDMEVHQFEITGMDDESEDDYEDYEKKVAL